jgi:hypothetical protein
VIIPTITIDAIDRFLIIVSQASYGIFLYIFSIGIFSLYCGLKYDVARELISDILSQRDVSLSVNSGSGIAELKTETGLPFRIKDSWATIGDDDRPRHLHLKMDEVVEVYKRSKIL